MSLAAGIVAGLCAGGMYLDAKFNVRDDLSALSSLVKAKRDFARAEKQNRVSRWYCLETACKLHWDQRAIWTREGTYTFGNCYMRAVQYANWLLKQGVGPDDCVALYMNSSADFFFLWFGAICIGAYPALLNHNLEGESLLHCVKLSEPKLILIGSDEECQGRFARSSDGIADLELRTIALDATTEKEVDAASKVTPADSYRGFVTGDTPFSLMFTSGTTGLPKACTMPHRKTWFAGMHRGPVFGNVPGHSCWYISMPLYHGTGGITSTFMLLSGVGIALTPRFSVSLFWTDVHNSGSTHFVYVGETARYLLNSPRHPLERDHKLVCGYGNGMRPDVWTRFQERFNIPEIAEFYNSTEGMMQLLNWDRGPFQVNSVGRHGLIRRMLFHNIYVPVRVDYETGDIWRDPASGFAQRVSYQEGGEILIAIPDRQAFQGYLNSPEATEKRFCTHVFKKGDLYYRTGDALRRDADGLWFFLDRLGDTFRWKSENVSTAEVAEVMGQFPGILEANVYGVDLPNHDGRAGCAAVQLTPGFAADPDWRALATHLSSRLPSYAVPVFLRVTHSASHTHNHKQNKVPLKKEGVNPKLIGTEVVGGEQDTFLWLLPKAGRYVPFTQADWGKLMSNRARL